MDRKYCQPKKTFFQTRWFVQYENTVSSFAFDLRWSRWNKKSVLCLTTSDGTKFAVSLRYFLTNWIKLSFDGLIPSIQIYDLRSWTFSFITVFSQWTTSSRSMNETIDLQGIEPREAQEYRRNAIKKRQQLVLTRLRWKCHDGSIFLWGSNETMGVLDGNRESNTERNEIAKEKEAALDLL